MLLEHVPGAVALGFDRLAVEKAPDVVAKIPGGRVAPVLILRQGLENDRLDLVIDLAPDDARPTRLGLLDGSQGVGHLAVRVVGILAGQQLVQDHAE